MNIEPVSEEQFAYLCNAVARAHGGAGMIVCGLLEADLTKGRGILEGNTRCLWTRDGRRITIGFSNGSLTVSASKTPDPECPKEQSA